MVSKGLMGWETIWTGLVAPNKNAVIPAKAGIQYAAASVIESQCLWDTGSPACAGDDGFA
jgi:hypothetical protein